MKTIWKFTLAVDDVVTVEMPQGAEILTCQLQHGVPVLWAIVDDEREKERRVFRIIGTGNPIPADEQPRLRHIGTVQDRRDGFFVWHVFELESIGRAVGRMFLGS